MPRKHIVPYIAIVFCVSLLLALLDHKLLPGKGTWNVLELKSVDSRFLFKNKTGKDASKDIALVLIDEKSYRHLNQPLIFYHTHIAGVIDYLVEQGVKTIGLDIGLPSISLETRVRGGYDSVLIKSFLLARKNGVDVVIGFSSRESAPLQSYLTAAGEENIATFKLTADCDDFIRRQELWRVEEGKEYASFPFLLAKKFGISPALGVGQPVLIDYTLARDIPVYSFAEVHERSTRHVPARDLFANRIVIIGTSLPFVDKHSTPLAAFPSEGRRRLTDGALIHAATVNTLLSRALFREPGFAGGALLIVLACSVSVFLCYNRRPLNAAVRCAILAGALLALSQYAFNHFYVLRITPLLAAVVLSFGATTVYHYYTEERRRKKIRERFSSYLPETIIDRIVDADIAKLTEGESRNLALLFSDIRGFTTYSENNRNQPQKVVQFLNRYHTEMTEIILNNQGTVSQLTGDGIFAFFGAPLEIVDPVFVAVKSAVEMRERIAALKSTWHEHGMEDLRIGIGIHYGQATVGNIGSIKKMEYVAIGDNTNVASRIEGLTKEFKETILMSDVAYARVSDRVIARPLGAAKIKGHSEVTVYAVDGLSGHK